MMNEGNDMKNNWFELEGKVLVLTIICLFLTVSAFSEEGPNFSPDDSCCQAESGMSEEDLPKEANPLKGAMPQIQHAEKMLVSVGATISKGKLEFVEALLREYENFIVSGVEMSRIADRQGKDVSGTVKEVETALKRHIEILNDLLSKVSEKNKSAVARALETITHEKERISKICK